MSISGAEESNVYTQQYVAKFTFATAFVTFAPIGFPPQVHNGHRIGKEFVAGIRDSIRPPAWRQRRTVRRAYHLRLSVETDRASA